MVMLPTLSIVIPAYNEEKVIEKCLLSCVTQKELADEIIVVDDNSPDGTADIVRNLMTEFPSKLFMEERSGKLGLGTAYIHGFKWAIQQGYQYVFEMDADFSHNPEDLLRLYDACVNKNADQERFDLFGTVADLAKNLNIDLDQA